MKKRKKFKPNQYVVHPRFGNESILSRFVFSKEEIEKTHWRYKKVKFFPESVIPADISKQNYALYPRKFYVDIEEQCTVCKRLFLFFALEQKHWFEELGFYVDAECTRCIDCRIKDHEIKNLQMLYQDLILKENRSAEETKKLKQAALELYQMGYMKNIEKINQIK